MENMEQEASYREPAKPDSFFDEVSGNPAEMESYKMMKKVILAFVQPVRRLLGLLAMLLIWGLCFIQVVPLYPALLAWGLVSWILFGRSLVFWSYISNGYGTKPSRIFPYLIDFEWGALAYQKISGEKL